MKVSVITINYNNASGLVRTIESVLNQTFKDFEYIVIDGGSTDGSIEILNKYTNNISYWVSEKDSGIYNAMNKGICKASGEYFMFLNSGDCLVDYFTLNNCVDKIIEQKNIDFFYGNILVANDKYRPQIWLKEYPHNLNLDFFKEDTINHQASFIKAEVFKEISLYPEYYKLASDYWLYLKGLLDNKSFFHLDFPVVIYDLGGITGLDYQSYLNEKHTIWQKLIPDSVKSLMHERDNLKNLSRYTIIRYGILINDRFQLLKNFFIK